ncbi:hypothetical protein U8V72_18370 [Priestia filamentosa]|uniref:hypothetical protein n=1 Tax=Priestia filamentosa TaxID=1402861 RepID=UPI0039798FFD
MSIHIVTKVDKVKTPRRSTKYSAGYDVFSNKEIKVLAGQEVSVVLPAGIDFNPQEHTVYIFLRSSMGINNHLRLVKDNEIVPYLELEYEQPNKQQFVTLRNVGKDDFVIEEGLHYLQYVIVDKKLSYLPFSVHPVDDLKGKTPVAVSIKETKTGVTFILEEEVTIPKGQSTKIASGYKVKIELDSFLLGAVPTEEKRFSYSNGVCVGDADFYLADGHYLFSLDNLTDRDLVLEKGTTFVELKSIPYYKADNEIVPTEERKGGIGSTTGEKKGC